MSENNHPVAHTEDPLGQWGAHDVIPSELPDTANTGTHEFPTLPLQGLLSAEADTVQHSRLPIWDTAARERAANQELVEARRSAARGGAAMTLAFGDLVRRNARATEQIAVQTERGSYVLPLGRTEPGASPFTRRNVGDLRQRLVYSDNQSLTGGGRHRKTPRHRAP
jgi:hypothetical protein